ncbi:MAG: hypothetical protein GEV12_21490 [Micromonosporaceae bacterium]|nr:hypothetical protein [Micromonosporaceae bacterium]
MVYVRLERDWTDTEGNHHPAGAMVDVDAGTLAQLQAQGVVSEQVTPDGGWVGPSGGGDGAGTDGGWVGPSGGGTTGGGSTDE